MSIHMKFSSLWTVTEKSAFVGTTFINNNMIKPQEVFADVSDKEQIINTLNSVNGFWGAVVLTSDRSGWVASDRIRSRLLFYATKGQDFYISDDCHWVREASQIVAVDEDARQEFLMTAQITGSNTLFVGLYQLQAGEIIFFEWSDIENQWKVSSERYYRYLMRTPIEYDEQKLLDLQDEMMQAVFGRLCQYANGRTIVLPLSGGYDSRLIALMLKTLHYPKIIAFSYGVQGNEEAQISREVAEGLDIPWLFVEYKDEERRKEMHSPEMMDYKQYAGNYASLPHTQDWFAVKALRERGELPADSVFVAGYSADLLAGSRSKDYPKLYTGDSSNDDAIEALVDFLYCLSKDRYKHSVLAKNKRCIKAVAGDLAQYINPASLYVSVDFAERQAKFINNAVRVYEFWGYDWWTPYWDLDFLNYWASVPLMYQLYQKLYLDYVVLQSRKNGLFIGMELKRDGEPSCPKHPILKGIKSICIRSAKDYMPYSLYFYLLRTKYNLDSLYNSDEITYAQKSKARNINGVNAAANIFDILTAIQD